ncbi:UNVERIFIED_CONTAM: hypothetical protein Slati_1405700 [Sesamum latifolium]|uniref:SWIM-type domain-containing protein n=1 Tax=Sesamum latifolium TaxID=2727402 RepID=A0AAW2X439_9LAMI
MIGFNDKPAFQWSRSHFSETSQCDMLLNNVCETFNSCILDAREKPILTMLEWIREYIMRRMQQNRDRSNTKWKHKLCPKIQQILQKQASKVSDCMPIKADDLHYQVSCFDGSQHCVDLGAKSCSCRKWQLSGIPCKHACCAIYHKKSDPIDYITDCYSVDTYRRVYEPAIQPMSHEGLWSDSLIIPPLPPNFGRGPGRPAKARRREAGEGASRRDVRAGKRKAVDSITEKNRNEIEHGGSSGTQHPDILPPLHTEAEPTHEACITQQETGPQALAVSVLKAGPSMYEQLSMSNKHMTLQSRVQIRAPPPMSDP